MRPGDRGEEVTTGVGEEATVDGPPLTDEADAVTRTFLEGGPLALRSAYDAHSSLVFTFCRRALGPDRAADATQEVFTEVWRNRHRFDPAQGTLRAWVMGIARYKVLGALRRDGSHPSAVSDAAGAEQVVVVAETERLADRLTLTQALRSLPERTRTAIQLSYVDGLSHREIAERTGTPLGSVKSDIRRGLERLRFELGAAS